MAAPIDLLVASALRPFASWLDENGYAVEQYFDRTHIPIETVYEGGFVTRQQAFNLASDIAQREFCPDIGFRAYLPIELSAIKPVAMHLTNASTVKEALEIFCKLSELAYTGTRHWIEYKGETACFCYSIDQRSLEAEYGTQCTLMIAVSVLSYLIGTPWRPNELRVQHRRMLDISKVKGLENCRVTYGTKYSGFSFPIDFLSKTNALRSFKLEKSVSDSQTLLSLTSENPTFSHSLQKLLYSGIPHHPNPSLLECARVLSISERTLKRRLQSEGESYRQVLDRVRFEYSRERLENSDCKIMEIANDLGYSGSNNFIYAFRRFAGVSPTEYRSKHKYGLISES